jgi:sec-independent protein translocase protein TatC
MKTPSQLKKADDLFEKSSMSFGDHLEALRKALVWAFVSLGIGMLIGIPFADWAVNYIQTPLRVALKKYENDRSKREIEIKTGETISEEFFQWMEANGRYWQQVEVDVRDLRAALDLPNDSFAEHAVSNDSPKDPATAEVNTTTSPNQEGSDSKVDIHKLSVDNLRKIALFLPIDTKTDALGMQEGFMIWLKAGFALGFIISSPGIFYALWTFVAAGLYPHERRYVYFFLPVSVGLFVGGACLAFFFIFQFVIDFLLKFNDSMGINASPRLTDYMSFAIFLPLGFGIAFQLPLVMLVLERLGIVSVKTYLSQWRAAILIIAFLSMILTPAEVTSMIGMCVPLIGLYFLGIAMCHWLPRKGSPHEGYDPK